MLKKKVSFSEEQEFFFEAVELLGKSKYKGAFNFLIKLLGSNKAYIRNSAALALASFKDDRAIKPLLQAIDNPENSHACATLVYVLGFLDCSSLFEKLVYLSLNGNFEVQDNALMILGENKFKVSKTQLMRVKRLLQEYPNRAKKCEDWKLLLKELDCYVKRAEKALVKNKI